ncbi:MAG: NAD(P)-dependent oxidoreductase, partial [Alphaproteobacteria bacterium]
HLRGRTPMLTPGKARELAHPAWVAGSPHLGEVTAWRPAIGLADGLGETLRWYREHGWL